MAHLMLFNALEWVIAGFVLSYVLAILFGFLPKPDPKSKLPTVIVIMLGIIYASAFSVLSILRHHALGTSFYDLGLLDAALRNTAHGAFFQSGPFPTDSFFTAHFSPLIAVLAPFYWLWEGPATILIIQSIALALGGWLVYVIASRFLENRWLAMGLALSFLLHRATQGVTLFDAHEIMLAPLLLLGLFYLGRWGKPWQWLMWLILTLLLREDMGLYAALLGWIMFWGSQERRAGIWIFIIGLGHFLLFRLWLYDVLVPGHMHWEAIRYSELGRNVGQFSVNILADPSIVLQALLAPAALFMMAQMLAPVAFLPFATPLRSLALLLPFFMLTAADFSALDVFGLHYPAFILPLIYILAILGLEKVRRWFWGFNSKPDRKRWIKALFIKPAPYLALVAPIVLSLAMQMAWAPRYQEDRFDARNYQRDRLATELDEIKQKLPSHAIVAASPRIAMQLPPRLLATVFPPTQAVDYVIWAVCDGLNDPALTARLKDRHWQLWDTTTGFLLFKYNQGTSGEVITLGWDRMEDVNFNPRFPTRQPDALALDGWALYANGKDYRREFNITGPTLNLPPGKYYFIWRLRSDSPGEQVGASVGYRISSGEKLLVRNEFLTDNLPDAYHYYSTDVTIDQPSQLSWFLSPIGEGTLVLDSVKVTPPIAIP